MNTFIVGQTLWWEYSEMSRGPGREVVITKIGRDWIYLNNRCRVDKRYLVADGGKYSPPGRCYLSKEAYAEMVELNKAWRDLRNAIISQVKIPDNVGLESIRTARRVLHIWEPE
jgi:hypothetical protein